MKNNLKKLTAIALSSLGILASAPSAFCAPKSKLVTHTPTEKTYQETAPIKRDDKLDFPEPVLLKSLKFNPQKNFVTPDTQKNDSIEQSFLLSDKYNICSLKYSWPEIKLSGTISAPFAKNTVEEKAFLNQVEMTSLSLPRVSKIDEYAFEGCENLNMLFLTSFIDSVSPRAFEGCNPSLKIVLSNYVYTVPEFLNMFASIEENATTYNYAVNTDEETLSFYNIAKR